MDEIYISVQLDEYLKLQEVKEFFQVLLDEGVEEWEGFNEALEIFLEDDETRDDPREL